MWIRRHWSAVVGALDLFFQAGRALFEATGDVDTFLAHLRGHEVTWLGKMIEFIAQPPWWFTFVAIAGGLILIWWDSRRIIAKKPAAEIAAALVAPRLGGNVLLPIHPEFVTPDWSIHDLFFYICPDVLEDHKQERWTSVGMDIRDRLSTGQLKAWAREIDPTTKRQSALVEVPASYWANAEFIYFFLEEGREKEPHSWTPSNRPTRNDYADIRVNKAQASSIWPIKGANVGATSGEPDTWVQDALMYVLNRKWPNSDDKIKDGQPVMAALQEMRTKASAGKLLVWGQEHQNQLPVLIERDFWNDHQFEYLTVIFDEPKNGKTERATVKAAYREFFALRVLSHQVEALWPH